MSALSPYTRYEFKVRAYNDVDFVESLAVSPVTSVSGRFTVKHQIFVLFYQVEDTYAVSVWQIDCNDEQKLK